MAVCAPLVVQDSVWSGMNKIIVRIFEKNVPYYKSSLKTEVIYQNTWTFCRKIRLGKI